MSQRFLSDVKLSTVSSGSMLKVDANGRIVAAVDGTDYISTSSTGYWTASSGSGIYYSDDVRIGTYQTTIAPDAKLHVFDYQTTEPKLLIEDGNTGDASMQFKISTQSYTIGVDNSDSDKFVLSAGSVLGTGNLLEITSNGLAAFQDSVLIKGTLYVNNQEQIQQGATEKIATFQNLGTERGYFEVTDTAKGYFVADGFKTSTASTGFLKADGSVDTGSFFSGAYGDLTGTPTLGTMAAASTNDYKTSDEVETYVAGEITGLATTTYVDTGLAGKLSTSGGTLAKTTSTTGTTGTTFLEIANNVGGDISQQQSFIDFKFTDTNANWTPQVRIGAQVGRDADANAISKEGAGAFVVYTGDGSDESGGGSLTEAMRVSYNGKLTVAGDIYSGTSKIATESFVISEAGSVQDNLDSLSGSLGTAAYTASTDYATAAQGLLADSALQSLPSHNHDGRYYTETEADSRFAQNGNNLVPINATDSNYQLFTEEVILATVNEYRGLAFPNGGKNFVFEVSVKGTNGANHQGIFWGLNTLATIYNNGEAGYKLTHQAEGVFHIRDIATNSNQATYQLQYAPNDGLYHRYKIISYVDPSNADKAFFKVYVDGTLVFNAPQFAAPPQVPTYFGFINYTGEATFSNWNVREITGEAELALLYGDGVFQPAGNYLTSLPAHNHDARYYTETEMDTFLAGKLSTSGKAADSNLLDGIDSSGFIKDFGTSAQANINTIGATSGKYRWNSSTVGRPAEPQANEYGTLLHLNYDANIATQLAYDIAESNLYIRHLTTSTDTASTWKRLLNTSDSSSFDAAGSAAAEAGAVQDNLDSLAGSLGTAAYTASTDYAAASHTHSEYLTSVPAEYLTQTEGDARYLQSLPAHNHDTLYDSLGSADAVGTALNERINTEVFDAIATVDGNIPTNNNQLTNGAGYITSADGGNAATLDGIDSTGFVKQLSDTSNPNYQTPSSRRVNPNATNPTNEHYAVATFGNNGNVTGQIATHFQTGKLYSRGYNSSWSAWKAYATESYVDTAVSNLVSSAPATLDTLNELAAALGDDANFSTTVANNIGAIDTRINDEVMPYIASVETTANAALPKAGGTMTGTLTLSAVNPRIDFNGTSDSGIDIAIVATPEGLNFIEPEQSDRVQFQILDDGGVNAPYGYAWNGQSLDSRYAASSHSHTFASLTSKPDFVNNGLLSGRATGTPDTVGDSYGVSVNYMQDGATNSPSGVDHALLTMSYSSLWQTQLAQDWRENGRIYIRGQENGTWSGWGQVWSSHDFSASSFDAAGSAAAVGQQVNERIDTEVFDAISAAQSTADAALPKAGGTITGSLTIGAGVTLSESTDRADLLSINSGTSGWGGLQITNNAGEGIWSFMVDGSAAGIYDDQNGDWAIYCVENSYVELRHNSSGKLATKSTGVTVTGRMDATSDVGVGAELNLPNVHSASKIQLHGDDGDAHCIGTASYNNTYGPVNWTGGTLGHVFYGATNSPIAVLGEGGATAGVNTSTFFGDVIPFQDRANLLGRDTNRWQIVFCEILDSAGQHEKNLQNPEGEKSVGEYETGTVLVWKGGKNVPCNTAADHMRMGIAVKGIDSPLIQGAEPVLVTGAVNEGDYLVTSSKKEGHAEAISPEFMRQHGLYDCVLGKALESAEGQSHLVKTWINI